MNDTIREIVGILSTMTDMHQRCILRVTVILKQAWEES